MMSSSLVTPTEALLEVAKQHPTLIAVRSEEDQWSYAALWARVRQIANEIHDLDETRNPVGLYTECAHSISSCSVSRDINPATSLEVDYVAAAHAIWLSGRTVVFLSSKWTPEVLQTILERANVRLVLFGTSEPPAVPGVRAVSTYSLVDSATPPSHVLPPSLDEVVETVPRICSITPTSGSTGVPKSIVYPMRRSLAVLSEESSVHFKAMDGQWLRGGTVSVYLPMLVININLTHNRHFCAPFLRFAVSCSIERRYILMRLPPSSTNVLHCAKSSNLLATLRCYGFTLHPASSVHLQSMY